MNRISRALAALAIVGGALTPLVAGVGPANAATTCQDVPYSPGFGWHRVCDINTTKGGARLEGRVDWNYNSRNSRNPGAQSGFLSLIVYDTKADGSCAWIRFRANVPGGGEAPVSWVSACGKGTNTRYAREFNAQEVGRPTTGNYYIDVCSSQSDCQQVWYQSVAEVGPR